MKRIPYFMVFVMLMFLILPMKSSAKNIDLNKDGKIGMEDAILALQSVSGLRVESGADVSLSDVIAILRTLSGINTELCLLDPDKAAPGICGCGVPDTDSDNDGTPVCNSRLSVKTEKYFEVMIMMIYYSENKAGMKL